MPFRIVELLQPVQIEIDDAGRRAVTFGIGENARQFANEGATVLNGRQRILVGELLEIFDPRPAFIELLAHPVDFLHQLQDGFLNLGRQLVRRDAENRRGVRRPARRFGGRGFFRFADPTPAAGVGRPVLSIRMNVASIFAILRDSYHFAG